MMNSPFTVRRTSGSNSNYNNNNNNNNLNNNLNLSDDNGMQTIRILLLGDSGVGKTSVVNYPCDKIVGRGWQAFKSNGSGFEDFRNNWQQITRLLLVAAQSRYCSFSRFDMFILDLDRNCLRIDEAGINAIKSLNNVFGSFSFSTVI